MSLLITIHLAYELEVRCSSSSFASTTVELNDNDCYREKESFICLQLSMISWMLYKKTEISVTNI